MYASALARVILKVRRGERASLMRYQHRRSTAQGITFRPLDVRPQQLWDAQDNGKDQAVVRRSPRALLSRLRRAMVLAFTSLQHCRTSSRLSASISAGVTLPSTK